MTAIHVRLIQGPFDGERALLALTTEDLPPIVTFGPCGRCPREHVVIPAPGCEHPYELLGPDEAASLTGLPAVVYRYIDLADELDCLMADQGLAAALQGTGILP